MAWRVQKVQSNAVTGRPLACMAFASSQADPGPLPTVVPAAQRLIAVGDLHGDYPKTFRAFKLAGLIDDDGKWAGGETVAVQVRQHHRTQPNTSKCLLRMVMRAHDDACHA